MDGCSLHDSASGLVVELARVAALALALLEGEAHAHLHARLLRLRALARLVALASAVIAAHNVFGLKLVLYFFGQFIFFCGFCYCGVIHIVFSFVNKQNRLHLKVKVCLPAI